MLRPSLLRGLLTRNGSVYFATYAAACANVLKSAPVCPTKRMYEGPLRCFCASVPLNPHESKNIITHKSDHALDEDVSDVFGDISQKYSSRRTFRKTSPEQLDLKYKDADEDVVVQRFKSKTGRRNTPYWYFLQCKKLIKEDKLSEALVLFEGDMLKGERLEPEEYNYTVLIGGCGRVGYVKKAFQLYNNMKKQGLEPSDATYTALFNACAESPWKQSGLEQALKLKQEILRKNIPMSAITQHALLKTIAFTGDLKSCFQILREMLQSGQPITQETFQYLLISCVMDKQQGFRLALQVWHQMLKIGIKPDTQNYNILLRAARDCGIGNPGLASVLLLKRTEELNPKITSGRKSHRTKAKDETLCPKVLNIDALENELFVDSHTRNAVNLNTPSAPRGKAKGSDSQNKNNQCKSQGEVQMLPSAPQAEQNLLSGSLSCQSQLSPQSPRRPNLLDPSTCHSDVVALGPVKSASDRLALIGNLDGFLEKMASDGLEPSIKTITLLADVMEAGSQSVQSLIDVAKKRGIRLDVPFFNTLVKRVAKAGDLDGAKAVKTLMVNRGLAVNTQTFCSIALACQGQKDGLQLLSDVERCGLVPNAYVFSALIGQATKRLDYGYLHELLLCMHKLQVQPNEVIIRQLEYAAEYPPSYDKLKSRNIYMEKIDGFRGFYKEWLEFMPGQETLHPWEKYRSSKQNTQQKEAAKEVPE
ncbi:Pentatricopeptide repeat-containing protein 1, mitochondrial [Triplophysa tibetana]|uniref:Pentatricopeptide repeat-containing protein 1, mitochondrial n=1 Tax=Triplophysa tibetana TaxID=1572043 RepID=A0A5A9PLA4_9TELE|nr:Pentatricopeptide repeat-containing protein 1, mitochondrial [Triplophysa tibetana]